VSGEQYLRRDLNEGGRKAWRQREHECKGPKVSDLGGSGKQQQQPFLEPQEKRAHTRCPHLLSSNLYLEMSRSLAFNYKISLSRFLTAW
jgi:hypothetical protein